jgi:peptidoglycan hydrolase-like protein with peptidoglycan-binding domain
VVVTQPRSYTYTPSTAAQVQRKLKDLGYYNGAVDGAIGPMSREAIQYYQEQNGLELTGQIDRALLDSLGL